MLMGEPMLTLGSSGAGDCDTTRAFKVSLEAPVKEISPIDNEEP